MAMKKFSGFSAVLALAALVSCQRQQSEEEKNAEIERQAQQSLAAEHQTEQQLNERQADLDARERTLAEKENTAARPSHRERTESESIESRPGLARESASSGGYSTFYTKLEPYGAWFETSDYGYVWQPRQAESSRSWRPYTSGRWIYTEAGWTWISEEPFGWATYHYGRWTRLGGVGWVWVPGNQWAPAWVSWRKSNDYVGWAPLPPEARFDQRTGIHNWSDSYYDIGPDQYCFVASREFGAPRVEQTLLPPERNVTIINQTTNVTNITYNNTTIVNEGPSYDELRSVSREPVERFRLERNVNIDVTSEPPRPIVQGETVVIAAPVIAPPAPSERPPNVKQTIAAAAVDLGWEAIADHEAAKKAREKMKSEATPPPNVPPKKFVKTVATTTAAQSSETSASPTSTPTPALSVPQPPIATATSTLKPLTTPRRAAMPEQSATPTPLSSPSAFASPMASQRRGRLLVPSATPSATFTPVPAKSPAAAEATASPASTLESTQSKGGWTGRGFKAPNESASASPTARSTSAPRANASPSLISSPAEKLTRQEKKEQKREEKKELKRERKEGFESASSSPQSSP
jgi:hypothetical protein